VINIKKAEWTAYKHGEAANSAHCCMSSGCSEDDEATARGVFFTPTLLLACRHSVAVARRISSAGVAGRYPCVRRMILLRKNAIESAAATGNRQQRCPCRRRCLEPTDVCTHTRTQTVQVTARAHPGISKGADYGKCVESEPIRRSGAEPPAGSRGRAPCGVKGQSPLKLKAFYTLLFKRGTES